MSKITWEIIPPTPEEMAETAKAYQIVEDAAKINPDSPVFIVDLRGTENFCSEEFVVE